MTGEGPTSLNLETADQQYVDTMENDLTTTLIHLFTDICYQLRSSLPVFFP